MSMLIQGVKGVGNFIKHHMVQTAGEAGKAVKPKRVVMPMTSYRALVMVRRLNREMKLLKMSKVGGHADQAKIMSTGFEKITEARALEIKKSIDDFRKFQQHQISAFLESRRLGNVATKSGQLDEAIRKYLQAYQGKNWSLMQHALGEMENAAAAMIKGG